MVDLLSMETFDLIFYLGIIGMAVSVIVGLFIVVLNLVSGKKLKEQLDKEYGNPDKYNRESR